MLGSILTIVGEPMSALEHCCAYSARVHWTPEEIKRRRMALGFRNQREFAAALGVSQRAVAKWEAGIGEPSAANIRKLDEVLGVPPAPPSSRVALDEATDTQLLAEIAARFARSYQSGLPRQLQRDLVWPTERAPSSTSDETGEDPSNEGTHSA